MLGNANCPASPINNVSKDKRAKMDFAKMAALITKIVRDNMSAFKNDVSIPAPSAKLADQTPNAKLKTKLNTVAVHPDSQVYLRPSRVV